MGTSMIINEQGELDVNVDNKTITYSKQTVPTTLLTQTTGIPLTLPVGQKITFNLDT
jgi:hypothetical protein